jgi:F-type H+-transporting ATPase subunit a
MLHISLAAERLWTVWGLGISNSLLTAWVVMGLLIVLSILATRKLTMVPSTGQLIAETLVGGLHDFFGAIAGKRLDQFFPLIASLFIFILAANWVGLLPGVGTVGYFRSEEAEVTAEHAAPASGTEAVIPVEEDSHAPEAGVVAEETVASPAAAATEEEGGHGKTAFVPILRGATADLNMTLALAIVAVIAMQYFGFRNLGTHYLSRFVNFKDPILFSVGILELVSDVSKIVSFAFRLFGNIFAGEVLLAVIAFLMPFFLPLPFMMLELFVGVIQALVFSMLTTAFLNVAVSHGEEEHAAAESHASA